MKLAILSGGFPPDFDAIGDYTWFIGEGLMRLGNEVAVYTSEGLPRTPPQGASVNAIFSPDDPRTIERLFDPIHASRPDWLIVQYNPFSFGPRGYNPWLNRVLRRIKKESKVRIAVMFHETCVPMWPWKFLVMRAWQYPQFSSLCRLSDAIFVSTTRWAEEVKRVDQRLKCEHLPVGSSLPLCSLSKSVAKNHLNIASKTFVVGIFGSAHASRLIDWMGEAARAIHQHIPDSCVLYVGKDGKIFGSLCQGVPFDDRGPLPAEEASICIRAMDLLLAPFEDGLSTRRSSVIAGFQHQVGVSSTRRDWSDRIFDEFPAASLRLSSTEDKAAFIKNSVQMAQDISENPRAAEALSELHDRIFAWPVIARSSVAALREQ